MMIKGSPWLTNWIELALSADLNVWYIYNLHCSGQPSALIDMLVKHLSTEIQSQLMFKTRRIGFDKTSFLNEPQFGNACLYWNGKIDGDDIHAVIQIDKGYFTMRFESLKLEFLVLLNR